MPITLLCLVKGNTTTNAFSVKISRDEPVSDLKDAIKAKKAPEFDSFPADKLKLWKKEVPDDRDDLLSNLTLNDEDELLATREIGDYWTEKPPKRHIHVLVESPVSTATSSREQELLDQIASLKEKLSKFKVLYGMYRIVRGFRGFRNLLTGHYITEFDVVVKPKRTKALKWTVDIDNATLEGLKEYIRGHEGYDLSSLKNDGAVLTFIASNSERYSPRNDQDFCEMLRIFVLKENPKFTVHIETPSKAFSDWSFPKVCKLYGLSDDPSPSIDVYPGFDCGCVDTKNEKYKEALRKLFDELETRVATTPIDISYEPTRSLYSYTYLASATFLFKDQVKIVPEKLIEGKYGRGNLDYGIESRATGRIIGLIEVKKDDFKQGFAQATVQMESTLGRKRKANEVDEYSLDKVWGIVTDAEKWHFMECTQDSEGKLSFKLSKPLIVVYEVEGTKDMAEKILGHIIWLLEEIQTADLVLTVNKEREIKRIRSTEDLVGKVN